MPFQVPDRIRALPTYLFVEIDRRRRAALEAGRDVIDLGIGDPDRPTPDFVIDRMQQAIRRPAHHRYPPQRGTGELRGRAAEFFQLRYGVRLDPEREILALIGTKEGLGHLPLAVVNPGDRVLIPDPAYPVYRAATIFAGGVPVTLPLSARGGWLLDLDALRRELESARHAAGRRPVLLFVNYPNNPTGATASLEFFEELVGLARQHDLIVAQDAAYSEVYLTDEKPPSILQVPGAREVAVEFHSLSKTFNMTGWRLGLAVGNAEVLDALARIKSNVDSGQFAAIQEAGAEALAGIQRPEVGQMRAVYRERAAVLVDGLRQAGFDVRLPRATFYVWAGVPPGYDSMSLATRLLDEAGVVCVPGVGFGPAGEGYVRFALTVEVDRIRMAVARLRELRW